MNRTLMSSVSGREQSVLHLQERLAEVQDLFMADLYITLMAFLGIGRKCW